MNFKRIVSLFLITCFCINHLNTMIHKNRFWFGSKITKTNGKKYINKTLENKQQSKKHKNDIKSLQFFLKTKESYQTQARISELSHKIEKKAKEIHEEETSQTKTTTKSEKYISGMYILTLIGGSFAIVDIAQEIINYFQEHDVEEEVLEAAYDMCIQKMFSDETLSINEKCQKITGMDLKTLEIFFETEVGMSLKKVVITAISKKLQGESIEETLIKFQEKLKTNPTTRKEFLKITSRFLYPQISQQVPSWIENFGLTEAFTQSYAKSVYEYVISPAFTLVIHQLEQNLDRDLKKFNQIIHATVHTAGSVVISPIFLKITDSIIKSGFRKTMCLIPGFFIPIDLIIRCNHNKLKDLLHQIDTSELLFNQRDIDTRYFDSSRFALDTYFYYMMDSDLGGTTTKEDLLLNVIRDSFSYELHKTKDNFEIESFPIIKQSMSEIIQNKSDRQRLVEAVKFKLLGNN